MNFYAICSALLKEEDSTGSVFFEIVKTPVNLVKMASQKAQLIHNQAVQSLETEAIIGDELWSFVKKTETVSTGRAECR